MWVEVDEFGEPVPLTDDQRTTLHERATNLCLWHLGQGPRTRKQLLDAMSRKGIPPEMAEAIVDKLSDYRYVDDAAYAQNYVASRHRSQRKAGSALRYELLRKGVDLDTVEEALEQVTPESESQAARELVDRKLRSTRGLDRQKRINRLVGMLARKGYSPSVAFQIVREAVDSDNAESVDGDC